jgi:Zn-dependent protease with chaperone function
MKPIDAVYYDGKTSGRRAVRLLLNAPHQLVITGLDADRAIAWSDIRISDRIGNTPRYFDLPDGARCESLANDVIDQALAQNGQSSAGRWLHRLESHWRLAAIAAVAAVFSVWLAIEYAIPSLAGHVASALPLSVDERLGAESFAFMDNRLFHPSRLPPERQRALRDNFLQLTTGRDDETSYRLEFRRSEALGANALAFPGGIIVMTDALVELARDDREIIAVLTHEIGHVVHRHATRRLLQDSAVALLIIAITGDITSISSLSAALPTMLVQGIYSRGFEIEADRFAFDYLSANEIPLHYFSDILARIDAQNGERSGAPDFLRSHPATVDRARMFAGTGTTAVAKDR